MEVVESLVRCEVDKDKSKSEGFKLANSSASVIPEYFSRLVPRLLFREFSES